jgi:hypothetical protein
LLSLTPILEILTTLSILLVKQKASEGGTNVLGLCNFINRKTSEECTTQKEYIFGSDKPDHAGLLHLEILILKLPWC